MTSPPDSSGSSTRDQLLVERLAEGALREQRARRRWGIFFRFLFFAYVAAGVALYLHSPDVSTESSPHAAVVEINGVINASGPNSAFEINDALRRAFDNDAAQGVILRINSPGGSPVESSRIHSELMRLRERHPDKKVYAVAGDACASGGYYVASAADEIYVDANSQVGSIGVIYAGFGFSEAMKNLGVERRVQTSGTSKNLLDPFLPSNPHGEAAIQDILRDIHRNFAAAVREGRGDRLSSREEVFSGAFFSGRRSIELGLADGLGDDGHVAREIIGVDSIVVYNEDDDFIGGALDRFGAAVADALHARLLH